MDHIKWSLNFTDTISENPSNFVSIVHRRVHYCPYNDTILFIVISHVYNITKTKRAEERLFSNSWQLYREMYVYTNRTEVHDEILSALDARQKTQGNMDCMRRWKRIEVKWERLLRARPALSRSQAIQYPGALRQLTELSLDATRSRPPGGIMAFARTSAKAGVSWAV